MLILVKGSFHGSPDLGTLYSQLYMHPLLKQDLGFCDFCFALGYTER